MESKMLSNRKAMTKMHEQTCKQKRLAARLCSFVLLAAFVCAPNFACSEHAQAPDLNILDPMTAGQSRNVSAPAPDLSSQINETTAINPADIPRFAANSPFDIDYEPPVPEKTKRLWAKSCLWDKAPEFVVEKWITEEPDTKGKYILLEFWATWCSQCRRAVPLLNGFSRKYKDEMAVIGVSDEKEQIIRNFENPKIEYNIAIDTQASMKKALAVTGIPHVIIIEPGGHVVWEGFPLLNGYELTEEVIEKILAVGRDAKVNAASEE